MRILKKGENERSEGNMFFRQRMNDSHQAGFKQGLWTALLVASPFILAGIKWMADNKEPVMERMKDFKETDLYTRVFDKESYQEKEAQQKLEKIRSSEGNYNNFDVEAAKDDDAALFNMIKEITKKELSKRDQQSANPEQ